MTGTPLQEQPRRQANNVRDFKWHRRLHRLSVVAVLLPAPLLSADASFVWVPDPHLNQHTQEAPPFATWKTQTDWIASHQAEFNIQAVLCGGDFDQNFLEQAWTYGWSTVDATGIPYLSAIGNHDYPAGSGGPWSSYDRSSSAFDAQIGYSRIHSKPWYGGFWPDPRFNSKANQYIRFTAGTTNWMVIALELFPRPEVIAWATRLIHSHISDEVVIITHAYMNTSQSDAGFPQTAAGSLINTQDEWGPRYYGLPEDSYSGSALAAWATRFHNVHLVLCGHNDPPAFVYRLDGNVHGIMADYQDTGPVPSENILLLGFSSSSNTLTVRSINTTTGDQVYAPLTLPWPGVPDRQLPEKVGVQVAPPLF